MVSSMSFTGIPSIADIFSITSSLHGIISNNNGNACMFRNDIKAKHACSKMFSTLFVKSLPGYFGYDVVLNPSDGPPADDYNSSASNNACVISLIAGLSVHLYVLSVKSNFLIYYQWHVTQIIHLVKL